MSGLTMRTRIITVVSSAAIIAPFALMGGSANAASTDGLTDGLPVVGGLVGTDGLPVVGGLLGGGAGPVGGALGTVSGLPVVGGLAGGTDGVTDGVTDGLLGDVLDLDVLDSVTSLVDLENVLSTVTDLVNIDDILKTVTDLVDLNDLLDLNLDKLINLPVKINSPSVKGATKDSSVKGAKHSTVKAGALPHTGGNADLTAMLLCAGLAVAGTGVTMVTRRRNALGMASA